MVSCVDIMFQGVFRTRGRYETQREQDIEQIPVHQSLVPLEGPRQLTPRFVRELEHDVVMQQENDAGNNPSYATRK